MRVTTFEVVTLLTIYPCNGLKDVQLLLIQQSFIRMDAHLSADFSEHLAQQCKQSHYHLSCLLVSMPALLPVGQVRFFNVIVLRPQSMFAQLRTDATHHLVCSHGTFPKQLHVSGETHQAFIAACIRIDSIKVLHVWFPSICQNLLLLLDLQLPGQFQQYAVYQLVVCQLVRRINPDAAEDFLISVC